MWIETPEGMILNANEVFLFAVDPEDNRSIYAERKDGEKCVILCTYDSTKQAKDALKEIANGFAKGEKVLVLK